MGDPRTILGLGWVLAALTLGAPLAWAQAVPKTVADAVAMEAADALPITDFYATPGNLARTWPGDLLRKAAFEGYTLPAGARAVRILYHSRDADGHAVATSGVVLIPAGAPPKGGWPIIAWAHGTSGVARACAPSLMKDVYYGEEGLLPMLRAGYAVVATDYHGLGSEGRHQYIDPLAQAQDVVFSISAAHAADPELGARWVVDGHSQGGSAAWGVAELEHKRADPSYLGAVAVAPASQLRRISGGVGAGVGFYLDYVAWAITAVTPGFKASDMLTGDALARYGDVTTKGCFAYGYASYLGDTAAPVLRSGWDSTPGAQRLFHDADIGAKPIAAPLLVIAGEADQTVPLASVRTTVRGACKRGVALQLRTYPGLDHDPVMYNSTPDQLAWIADRFAGKPAANTCTAAG